MQFQVLKGKSDSRHQIATRVATLLLFADVPVQMTWMVPSSLTLRRKERESDVVLSHSL